MADYSVILIKMRTTPELMRVVEDAVNNVLTTFAPESICEVYDTAKDFENRYEDEF